MMLEDLIGYGIAHGNRPVPLFVGKVVENEATRGYVLLSAVGGLLRTGSEMNELVAELEDAWLSTLMSAGLPVNAAQMGRYEKPLDVRNFQPGQGQVPIQQDISHAPLSVLEMRAFGKLYDPLVKRMERTVASTVIYSRIRDLSDAELGKYLMRWLSNYELPLSPIQAQAQRTAKNDPLIGAIAHDSQRGGNYLGEAVPREIAKILHQTWYALELEGKTPSEVAPLGRLPTLIGHLPASYANRAIRPQLEVLQRCLLSEDRAEPGYDTMRGTVNVALTAIRNAVPKA